MPSLQGGGLEQRLARLREEAWERGHHVFALQGTRAPWCPGRLERLLGYCSATLAHSLLGESRNPLTRDGEATPATLILGPFARTRLLTMTQTRVPKGRELVTLAMLLLSSEEIDQVLTASHWGWSSGFSSGRISSTQRGNTEESVGHGTFANKLPQA